MSIWLRKEVFSIPSAFLPAFWTTAAKTPCNGVGHILEASSNFTWHMFLWGTLDLNDHREFSPKEAHSFDWGGHRIKAQCTDHDTPLQPTELHPSPLSPPGKMPLNANDVSFGNISKWQVSPGPSGMSFFSVLRTESSFELVDNVLLMAESARQSLRRYDTPSLCK